MHQDLVDRDALAFEDGSAYRDVAMRVLEERWVPNALHRHRPPGA